MTENIYIDYDGVVYAVNFHSNGQTEIRDTEGDLVISYMGLPQTSDIAIAVLFGHEKGFKAGRNHSDIVKNHILDLFS